MQRQLSIDEIRELLQQSSQWKLGEDSKNISADVIRTAIQNGYVFFEEKSEPKEVTLESGDFGFGMTYGEYWASFPEDRPDASERASEVQSIKYLLLIFDSSFLVLKSELQLDCKLNSRVVWDPDRSKPLPALLLEATNDSVAIGDMGLVVRDPHRILCDGLGSGWHLSNSTSIRTIPAPQGSIRYWDWGWPSTYGPALFMLYVERSRDELEAWLRSLKLQRYIDHLDTLVPELTPSTNLLDCYLKIEPGKYRWKEEDGKGIDLYIADGIVQLLHGRTFKSEQPSADSTLLHAIRGGALGDIPKWTLVDGDYCTLCFAGRGIESFRNYLDPNLSAATIRSRLSRYYPSVRPKPVDSLEEVLEEIVISLEITTWEGLTSKDKLENWIMNSVESVLPVELAILWNLRISSSDNVENYFRELNAKQSRVRFCMHQGYWE